MKADLRFGTGTSQVDTVVRTAGSRRAHYEAVRGGWADFLARRGVVGMIDVTPVTWRRGGTAVNVNPQFGLVLPNDQVVVTRIWFNESPPSRTEIDAMLHLMETNLSQLSDRATGVAVLDVRRSRLYTKASHQPSVLDRWLVGEAAGYATIWQAAA